MRNKQAAAGLMKSAPTVKDPLGYLQQANVAVEFLVKQASSRQSPPALRLGQQYSVCGEQKFVVIDKHKGLCQKVERYFYHQYLL